MGWTGDRSTPMTYLHRSAKLSKFTIPVGILQPLDARRLSSLARAPERGVEQNTIVHRPNARSAADVKHPAHLAVFLIERAESKLAIVGKLKNMVLKVCSIISRQILL